MRKVGKLTAKQVEHLPPGMHADGAGLYLQVRNGSRSWIFRYRKRGGRGERHKGLGASYTISLGQARDKARECRQQLLDGKDPLSQGPAKSSLTFAAVADLYTKAHAPSWTNNHARQVNATLKDYALPALGSLLVGSITTEHVLEVLNPIWHAKTVTASRVRQRVESILDYAGSRNWRGEAPNPPDGRGI